MSGNGCNQVMNMDQHDMDQPECKSNGKYCMVFNETTVPYNNAAINEPRFLSRRQHHPPVVMKSVFANSGRTYAGQPTWNLTHGNDRECNRMQKKDR